MALCMTTVVICKLNVITFNCKYFSFQMMECSVNPTMAQFGVDIINRGDEDCGEINGSILTLKDKGYISSK